MRYEVKNTEEGSGELRCGHLPAARRAEPPTWSRSQPTADVERVRAIGSRRMGAHLGALASLVLAIMPPEARAQDSSETSGGARVTMPRSSNAGLSLVRPTNINFTQFSVATFESFASERRFLIKVGRNELESTAEPSKSEKLERDVYFVLPVPALKRSAREFDGDPEKELSGYPDIVHHVRRTEKGESQLTLKFTLCTDGVMQLAHDAVVKRRAELKLAGDFDLHPWPFSEILCECRVRDGSASDDDILAVSYYGPLESEGTSSIMLPFDFTGDLEGRFLQAHAEDRLEFRFYVTYSGQQFSRVSYRISGAAKAATDALTALNSNSGEENYITQQDRDALLRVVRERIHFEGAIEGGGKATSLAPALLTSISFEALMRNLDKVELSGDELKAYLDKGDHKRQLASWCSSLVNQYLTSQQQMSTNSSGVQNEKGKTRGKTEEESGSVGGGISFLCFDFGGETTSTSAMSESEFERAVNFVSQQTGMQFSKSANENTYALSSISVFARSKTASQKDFEMGGRVSSYDPAGDVALALSPISSQFTDDILNANLSAPSRVTALLGKLSGLKDRLSQLVLLRQRADLGEPSFRPLLLEEECNPERDCEDLVKVKRLLRYDIEKVLPLYSARYLEALREQALADLARMQEELKSGVSGKGK